MLNPGDAPELYETIDAVNPLTGRAGKAIPMSSDGACIYLKDDRCSIYERRPLICRAFNCIDFAARLVAGTSRAERRRSPEIFRTAVVLAGLRQTAA